MATTSSESPAVTNVAHPEHGQSEGGLDHKIGRRIVKRPMDLGRKEVRVTHGRFPGHDQPLFAAKTPVVRWSATVEANGKAVLRVDCDGFSKISNIQDYASVVRTCAHQLLDTAGIARSVSAGEPVAWKTTERSVCVPFTDNPDLAALWRAAGFHVIDLFE